jgi:tetratricopeptide (TPR) repeat protein
MSRIACALFAIIGAGVVATGAHAQAVTVLGGGAARECSNAALTGESGPRFEEACTIALTSEAHDRLDRAGTYVNRGVMKLRRKEFGGAKADFDSAIQTAPELGDAYVNRGAALLGQRRMAESLLDFNRALELGVQEPEKAFYNRALAQEHLGETAAAHLDYQRAIALKPEWELPRRELARFETARP